MPKKTGFAMYDKETLRKIASKGGKNSKGAFHYDRDLARRAGSIGGKKSKRTKAV